MRTKGGIVTKLNNMHRIKSFGVRNNNNYNCSNNNNIHDNNNDIMRRKMIVCSVCKKCFDTEIQKMHHIC